MKSSHSFPHLRGSSSFTRLFSRGNNDMSRRFQQILSSSAPRNRSWLIPAYRHLLHEAHPDSSAPRSYLRLIPAGSLDWSLLKEEYDLSCRILIRGSSTILILLSVLMSIAFWILLQAGNGLRPVEQDFITPDSSTAVPFQRLEEKVNDS